MSVTQNISTDITATCDNKTCRRGFNGPTVVKWNVESVKSGQTPMSEVAKRFINILTFDGTTFTVCCPACGAELLGFPQPDLTGPTERNNVLPFCRPPFDGAFKEHTNSPVNGPEEAA